MSFSAALPLPPTDRPTVPPAAPLAATAATAARRIARWIGAGAVLAMLAAAPYRAFELDRFFVPKETVLLLVAAAACWAAARLVRDGGAIGRGPIGRGPARERVVDAALALYLAASLVSACLAPSAWLAARAVAISAAGAALFWTARAAARRGAAPSILTALVVAVTVAAATALLQAYGVRSDYFSVNRAPGGTFGNRNFVAHLCAIGLPLAAYAALRSERFIAALGAVGTTLTLGAMLVLSRSRGAWLAGAVSAVPLAIGLLRAATLGRAAAGAGAGWRPRGGRVLLLLAALGAGAAAAIRLPNTLDWRSDSPYLDSVKGVVDYKAGSGRGRLEQWQHSARLLADDPLLGVGPGNWSVRYPAVAPAGDPSPTEDRTTANPWPSSDLVAVASERGLRGLVAFGAVVLGLLWTAHRAVWGGATLVPGRPAEAPARALAGGALGGVIAATLVAGAFDAVLLLAAPTIVVWPALGALSALATPVEERERSGRNRVTAAAARTGATILLLGAGLAAAHLVAMPLYEDGGAEGVRAAARLAPGDYRVRVRAGVLAVARG
ncbi:MAG TPA: O-antigen ligase family protein, partial [Gemmatirosa sp.]